MDVEPDPASCAATSLGPAAHWPRSLKTARRIMLTSRQPIWIGWGKDLIYLYNDPHRSIVGGKHPWVLGRSTWEVCAGRRDTRQNWLVRSG